MSNEQNQDIQLEGGSLPQIATRLLNTPLMISRPKLDVLLSVLGPRMSLDVPKLKGAAYGRSDRQRDYQVLEGGVAVIPVTGSLVHRGSWIDAMSGLCNYQLIQNRFMDALRDQDVTHIVMELDSPGGEVHGVFDLAELIYKHRGEKPTTAAINEQSYSACYLIGSACDRIVLPRTAGAGSIGVIAAHVDWSKANEMDGLKVTTVFAGDRKNDFNPNEPLSDEALEVLKAHVNETYDLFVETVARNRGMSTKDVRDTKAGLFYGKSATKARLADKVQSFNDTLAELVQQATKRGSSRMENQPSKTMVEATGAEDEQKPATTEGGADTGKPNTAEGDPNTNGAASTTEEAAAEQPKQTAEVIDFEKRLKAAREDAATKADSERLKIAAEITTLCKEMKVLAIAGDLIASGKTVDEARAAIMDAKAKTQSESAIVSAPDGSVRAEDHGWGKAFTKASPAKKK